MTWTTTGILVLVAGMVIGYLLGSINFAIIITRLFGKGDIRKYGSGNAGMTNVLRTVGKGAAGLTLLGDLSKGLLAILAVRLLVFLFPEAVGGMMFDYLVAFAALLGHVFPVFYGFRGGKGILVSAGAMAVLSPWSLLICLTAFLIVTSLTRYVSAGSLTAAVSYPLANMLVTFLQYGQIVWLEVLLAVPVSLLIIYLHRANIGRLFQGTENKVSFRKKI